METIKEPKPITAEDVIRKPAYRGLTNLVLICDAMDEFASLKNAETIELYNRQCVRANDLQEENNRLKEKLKSMDEEGNFWLNHAQSLDGENKRLRERVLQLSNALEEITDAQYSPDKSLANLNSAIAKARTILKKH